MYNPRPELHEWTLVGTGAARHLLRDLGSNF